MNEVLLRNVPRVSAVLIEPLMLILESLFDEGLAGVYAVIELVELCRDPTHVCSKDEEEKLRELSLIGTDGRVHETTRDVVLSAASGDGVGLVLVSPYPVPT